MITGHFDLVLKNAKGLVDEDFHEAHQYGRLPYMLDSLNTELEAHTDNLVMDGVVLYLGYNLFQVTDTAGSQISVLATSTSAWFSCICLLTTDSEPNYTSEWNRTSFTFQTPSNVPESANTSSGGKRFKEDASEVPDVRSDQGGREAIFYRDRWLYLPSQGISSNIRSIQAHMANNQDGGNNYYFGRSARIRIKDAGGNPIIISKTSSQVLLVEYRLSFVSI